MQRYSFIRHVGHALRGHRHWQPAWRAAEPRKHYDVVIIGGGGHGLATAYYLATHYGIKDVAVLEKGYIGGGNTGRNTQVVRSNYFFPESAAFFDHSLTLFEGLSKELNLNLMFSQRGHIVLAHSEHELEQQRRTVNSIRLNGVDAEHLSPKQVKKRVPLLNLDARYPVLGAFVQARGGCVRHDALVWGLARAADSAGVDIIQNCEVTGLQLQGDKVVGVKASSGGIAANRVAIAVAGHTSEVTRMAGFRVPITSMALQAMVTEPVKPVINTMVISPTIHMYISQTDHGEVLLGAGADVYNSYAQRGGIPAIEETVAAALELFPGLSRLRLMRQWSGITDITPDTTPVMGKTPVRNLYLSGGWGTGGFKAIPAGGDTMAYTIANDQVHPLIRKFGLDRFTTGALIDEGMASGVSH